MQFHQAESQPYTYIVEDDNGKQLGVVDEFHQTHPIHKTHHKITYIAIRFASRDSHGMFLQKEFSGFTAAVRFVGENR